MREDCAVGKPAGSVAVRFPRPATEPLFEHLFDTGKSNPRGCGLVKSGRPQSSDSRVAVI